MAESEIHFSKNMSVEQFKNLYWYKTDLEKICRQYKLPTFGTKAELNQYVVKYLKGIPIEKIKPVRVQNNNETLKYSQITEDTLLFNSGFKLNNEARKFFAAYFKVDTFSFKKSMAIKMREVQTQRDVTATVKDLIEAYQTGTTELDKNQEEQTYQWNNFVRDFNTDKASDNYLNKMKVASILWKKVRDGSGSKKYRHSLIERYHQEIAIFEK